MKLIFNLIKVALIFLFIGVAFFLIINKTFFKEEYIGEIMNSNGIKLDKYVYFLEETDDLKISFITLNSKDKLNKTKDSYLNTLEKCNQYYYDKNNNITIIKYDIVDNNYYRNIYINYLEGNACK